jgi:hypothetical protein
MMDGRVIGAVGQQADQRKNHDKNQKKADNFPAHWLFLSKN